MAAWLLQRTCRSGYGFCRQGCVAATVDAIFLKKNSYFGYGSHTEASRSKLAYWCGRYAAKRSASDGKGKIRRVAPLASRKPRRDRDKESGIRPRQGRAPNKEALQTLRITGGSHRGHAVRPPRVSLRPMMAKVREALFATLSATGVLHASASALDLFAGSGIVGLEALSHGVGNVTFVDFSPACTSTITSNCNELGFANQTRVIKARAENLLASPQKLGVMRPFQLVTLTPPYEEVDYKELVATLAASPVLAPDSVVVIEYPLELGVLPQELAGGQLMGLRNKRYGRTLLGLYACRPTGCIELKPRPRDFART
eukprot:CAMPEP_0172684310 /NCGR_PEP_ID=MMETSP1074-20121228/19471_1 /TAXON_ID=2916 /ORGANISM="Ceratium fusus, Strain PA161109" /LENGTH=313 /DNA_ID=CAMNT_0013503301 /DNA_START=106 /DNA_END=1047 /DNA_ORIENTATION=+